MKKVFLVLAMFSTLVTQAQFVITDSVTLSTTSKTDSVYMEVKAHLNEMTDSVCQVDLVSWKSETAKNNGADRIFIEEDGRKVDSVEIVVFGSDSVAAIRNKVIAKLIELYGWTVE